MVLDDTLIDEDARGPIPGIDEDRIVRSVDRIDDESVGGRIGIEQEIGISVCKICRGAIQVADDARVGSGFGGKDGVVGAREYMIWFEVEVVK